MFDQTGNNGFDEVIIETAAERADKRRGLRRTFSRVFLALALYLVITLLAGMGIELGAIFFLGEERAAALFGNTGVLLLENALTQYLIALPIAYLVLRGLRKSEATGERTKLGFKDTVMMFAVSYAAMYVGAIIGNSLNSIIGGITGEMPDNSVNEIVSNTPMYLIFIFTVILAPIFEELLYRKLVIDRLSVYGDKCAIIFSAVAFGLFHGNLYQFFYAAIIGLVLGYVYTRTRNVKDTIILHMLLNFTGSVMAMPVQESLDAVNEYTNIMNAGGDLEFVDFMYHTLLVSFYETLVLGLLIAGVIVFSRMVKGREIKISQDKEIFLPDSEIAQYGTVNFGTIFFIVLNLILIVLNLFV